MVQIKAKDLKWCQAGIEHYNNTGTSVEQFTHIGERYVISRVTAHEFDEPVWVDPEEYKNSVISKIKEIFNEEVLRIEKSDGVILLMDSPNVLEACAMLINIDPMPWEEEYTITLGEE